MAENWTKQVANGLLTVQIQDRAENRLYPVLFLLDSMQLSSLYAEVSEVVALRERLVISGYKPANGLGK